MNVYLSNSGRYLPTFKCPKSVGWTESSYTRIRKHWRDTSMGGQRGDSMGHGRDC